MPFDTVSTWTITSKNQLWKENIPRKQYPQKWLNWHFCHSVARSCPTLCDLMDCSTPGFPVLRHLPELVQTYLHWVGDAIQPSCPLSSPSPPAVNLLEESRIALDFISPWRVSQFGSMWLLGSSFQHRTCQMSFRSFQNWVTHSWVSTWGLDESQDAVSLLIHVALVQIMKRHPFSAGAIMPCLEVWPEGWRVDWTLGTLVQI